jgi:hypothetical protein
LMWECLSLYHWFLIIGYPVADYHVDPRIILEEKCNSERRVVEEYAVGR